MYKERLVKFVVQKKKKCLGSSPVLYVDFEDIKEIVDEWSEEECKGIYFYIRTYISALNGSIDNIDIGLTNQTCPWCVRASRKYSEEWFEYSDISWYKFCDDCGYGRRHGICYYEGSTFITHLQKIKISNFDYEYMLKEVENDSE